MAYTVTAAHIPVYFADGFENYSADVLAGIIEKFNEKYKDTSDIIDRHYEKMRCEFIESYESKLYEIPRERYLTFKYPITTDPTHYKFTCVLAVEGKGKSWYYKGIGRFNVSV